MDDVPSSSPAFNAPMHPIRLKNASELSKPSILAIQLAPATLRPLAFRVFTKKHNLTLTSPALQALATFIGTNCGSAWREEGLAERVLDDVAKSWKKNGGGVIVHGDREDLQSILQNIAASITEGRPVHRTGLGHQWSGVVGATDESIIVNNAPKILNREQSQSSHRILATSTEDDRDIGDDKSNDLRSFLQVVGAFDQPRLEYNWTQKSFQIVGTPASLLPDPSRKTRFFRHRYNLIHQRLLRNESFQTSTIAPSRSSALKRSSSTLMTTQEAYKLTPIVNLLGRSGSNHLLLGLLIISPTGTLALCDLTGGIALDLNHAKPVPEGGVWFTPGMVVLVDGVYEEEGSAARSLIGDDGGIGGTIGGKFIGFSVGGPPCERRDVTVGFGSVHEANGLGTSGGFGWIDFLGVGSERSTGSQMRKLEQKMLKPGTAESSTDGRGRVIIMGEVDLTSTNTLQALRKTLGTYAAEPSDQSPMIFVLMGNFVQYAVMAGGGSGGSVEYKEYFNSLASVLSDYPTVLQMATFIFIPGDNDPWASTFSAGAATLLPRAAVPDIFTTRVKRAFVSANMEADKSSDGKVDGEVIWSTNPTRISLFGPIHEMVFFRDDMTSRLRRSALKFESLSEEGISNSDSISNRNRIPDASASQSGNRDSENMHNDKAVETAESHLPTAESIDSNKATIPSELLIARKLVKTVLDQGYLSPFPPSIRPVLWDYAGALHLYPLPSALVLMDPEAPTFAVTYEGCHAMNPGILAARSKKGVAQWIEYDIKTRRGKTREATY